MTMKSLFIIYDYQIFEMQRFGGISRYFCEIIKRISAKHKITVRYSINYYLTSWMLEKSLILLPRFIYKRYHSIIEKKNHEITKKLLKILADKNNLLFLDKLCQSKKCQR